MFIKKILDKPYRLMSIIGCVYIALTVTLNIFTRNSYEQSVLPFSKIITYASEGVSFFLCAITFFLYKKHFIYFTALEIMIFADLYSGRIYTAVFLSSILFIFLLFENKLSNRRRIFIYLIAEVAKLALVVPYGVRTFFEYIGIILFSLCSIGCFNLLFRHALQQTATETISLEDYKFTDRQKDCIKEIVVNNTTIKALAITWNVSESAIKKDLAHIYKVLGITGKADLKALFIGYKFQAK